MGVVFGTEAVEWLQQTASKKYLTRSCAKYFAFSASTVSILANGDCTEDATNGIPGQNNEPMDTDTFLMMGFLVLPLLFLMWSMFQRMSTRRRELPQGKAPRDGPGRDQGPPTPPVD
eukprot:CAMPEP_0181345206 /NCGR_PEP_ID=MMETSP1101-20121128/32622_1 /TAXON_ID=46948 /ORGANISM="Rhodomonas abbreviata, Strain Caron Lab Isolate" /LENGTH=116 /DNA_ID=CAMNT_0023457139 /DNA_START=241 /DNA_END=593 /DNA_ORIENTATION=+